MMSNFLFQVALGMVLGDATMYRVSREAIIKFEQGAIQKDFLFHVFKLFSEYCFMLVPGTRLHLLISGKLRVIGLRPSLILLFQYSGNF